MKKKNKGLRRTILFIVVMIASVSIMLASYVLQHNKHLMTYQKSLANLPEVDQVLEISEYSGMEFYYVAKVLLTTDLEYYYFIKDDIVEYSYPVTDLMTAQQAVKQALASHQGTVTHYYLGIYDEKPVYEVEISSTRGEEYVIVDAQSGDIVRQFVMK